MNRYNLLTQKRSGELVTYKVIEDTVDNKIFVNHAGNWCYSIIVPKEKVFLIKDVRTGNWVKRPIIALEKIQEREFEPPEIVDFSQIETFSEKLEKSDSKLMKSIRKETELQSYIETIIEENDIPLIIERNGLSGKNTFYKGDLLVFNSVHPNRKPIAIIEYLSRIQNSNSIRLDQKNIYDDYSETIRHRINYLISYRKPSDGYGFVRITRNNFRSILFRNYQKNQKRTSISISKLIGNEIDIVSYLRSVSKLKGLETRDSITEYQIQAYTSQKVCIQK